MREVKPSAVKKKANPISFLFFYVLLPILFAILLAVGVLQVIGFNVIGKVSSQMQQVPYVRHVLGEPPLPVPVPVQVAKLHEQLKNETTKTKTLTKQVNHLQTELTKAKNALITTQATLKKTQTALLVATKTNMTIANQAKVYTSMTPTQAEQIISQLPFDIQVKTLQEMNVQEQAAILSQFKVSVAAKLIKAGA